MKILLIGHSIIDHIDIDEKKVIKPGGLYYSALGMLSVISKKDKLFLLTSFNEKYYALFESIYSNTNMTYSKSIEEMPEVYLKIYEAKEREETYKNLSTSLSVAELNNEIHFDGILVNMITGFDLSIDQLNTIRNKFDCPIYFDLHTLSRGVDEKMNRIFRTVPDIEKWLQNIDILQCNENELSTIYSGAEEEIISKIFESRPRIVIVTKGENGSTTYSKSIKKIKRYDIAAEKVNSINKIGCGDLFGAIFFYSYLSSQNLEKSLIAANHAAAIAVSNDLSTQPEIIFNAKQ